MITSGSEDDVHRTYIKNIDGWKKCRDMFPMLQYDPCVLKLSKEDQQQFTHCMVIRMARSFRIQINLVLLDATVCTGFNFEAPHETLNIVKDVGSKIKLILDLSVDQTERDTVTKELIEKDLVDIRGYLAQTTEGTTLFRKVDIKALEQVITNFAPVSPLSAVDTPREQTILFFMLVEHLILRVARLHYYCSEHRVQSSKNTCCCSCFSKVKFTQGST